MGKIFERVRVGEVIDEEEGVGRQVGGRPHGAVFFLARGVGQVELVGAAVNRAGYRVKVFDCGVISGRVWSGWFSPGNGKRNSRAQGKGEVCNRETDSCVHCDRTRRRVIEDLPVQRPCQLSDSCLVAAIEISSFFSFELDIPHPPSPQMVIVILSDMLVR